MELSESQKKYLVHIFTRAVEEARGPFSEAERNEYFVLHTTLVNSLRFLPQDLTREQLESEPQVLIPMARGHMVAMLKTTGDVGDRTDEDLEALLDEFAVADVASALYASVLTVLELLPRIAMAEAAVKGNDWDEELRSL